MDITPANFASTPPQPQQHYNVWAILGFVFAFVFPLLGLVFGIIALVQLKRNPLVKGKGLALAGTIISAVFILAVVGLVAWGVMKSGQAIQKAQLQLTDAEIVSAAKEQQSLADDAYATYKGYPSSTYDHSLDTRGLIGLVAGINPYKSFMLFSPQGKCSANQDQYGYYSYKSLANKDSCQGGDKGDCQAYEISFCLQAALGEFKAGDNVISKDGPPPASTTGAPSAFVTAADATFIAAIKQFQTALELYYGSHHNYPAPVQPLRYGVPLNLCDVGFVYSDTACVKTYMNNVPISPATNFRYTTNGATYNLEFYLSQPVGSFSTTNCARPSGIMSGACPTVIQ